VLELDRRQPEATRPLPGYVARAVSPARVREGRARLAAHREALAGAEARSGVPAPVIVALWGLESDYGRTGREFPVIPALATLAFDGRRASLFRAELLDALRLVEEGHVALEGLRGSWAGATGQTQFLPSSFFRYAADGDGDGRRDIWGSPPDVLASIASYLVGAGWRPGEPWGVPVRLPPGPAPARGPRPVEAWAALGVPSARGGALLPPGTRARLLVAGPGGPAAYLLTENFDVLLRWNRSTSFAVAVGTLADRLAAAEPAPGTARARPRGPALRPARMPPGRPAAAGPAGAAPYAAPARTRASGSR
jgi:lytic murein transglycosylase